MDFKLQTAEAHGGGSASESASDDAWGWRAVDVYAVVQVVVVVEGGGRGEEGVAAADGGHGGEDGGVNACAGGRDGDLVAVL